MDQAFQVMEEAAYRSCHNADGVASATRLQFPDSGSPPEKSTHSENPS
jgi:hypothetical protein